jgi:hypothetical protein
VDDHRPVHLAFCHFLLRLLSGLHSCLGDLLGELLLRFGGMQAKLALHVRVYGHNLVSVRLADAVVRKDGVAEATDPRKAVLQLVPVV